MSSSTRSAVVSLDFPYLSETKGCRGKQTFSGYGFQSQAVASSPLWAVAHIWQVFVEVRRAVNTGSGRLYRKTCTCTNTVQAQTNIKCAKTHFKQGFF